MSDQSERNSCTVSLMIDTAHAGDKDDNCECWHDAPHAGSRRLLGVAHAKATSVQQDTAASHQVGDESPGLRSDQFSRWNPPVEVHSRRKEPYMVVVARKQEQTP